MVGHARTSSHRYFAQKQPYTVEHGRTYDHTWSNTVAQNLFLQHTVTQTTVHGRTRSHRRPHMVAQMTVYGRTWSHKKSSAARMAYPQCFITKKQRDKDLTLLNRWANFIPGLARFIPRINLSPLQAMQFNPGINFILGIA